MDRNIIMRDYFNTKPETTKLLQDTYREVCVTGHELAIDALSVDYCIDIVSNTANIKIINYHNIDKYIDIGFFYYVDENNQQCVAVNNSDILHYLLNFTSLTKRDIKIKLIKTQDFHLILERNFSHLNVIKSKYLLQFCASTVTAKNINFLKVIVGFNLLFFLCLHQSFLFFHLFNNFCYLTQNIFKAFLFKLAITATKNNAAIAHAHQLSNATKQLPVYSILVPLYQEVAKLESIIDALRALDYPKHKLDVKIVIESDDDPLIDALARCNLPSYIQIIIVPASLPRTKPKALNYAATYAIGEYITVYDAEDRPEADQLLKSVAAFQQLPQEYVCIQAKLNFYNTDENLLTRFLSIEYIIWFEYLLKGLSICNFPVPLGGTSNHLKTEILRTIGYWDAYNVTEDAELGVRLYACGYKTYILDSYTFEESPIDISTWINQRSRWVKGFIQTFIIFVICKSKRTTLTLPQVIATYILIGLSTYSFYCVPWIIVLATISTNTMVNYLWITNSFFAISYSYSTALYALKHLKTQHGTNSTFHLLDYLALIIWPLYFILHSIASYRAMYEIVRSPFFWNKTQHGLSTQNKPPQNTNKAMT